MTGRTAISELLATEENSWDRRLIAVFQPHRYTRTRDLLTDFYTSFYHSDVLIITDIYPAGEKPIEGITASLIAEGVKQHGHRDVHYISDKQEISLVLGISPKIILSWLHLCYAQNKCQKLKR